MISPRPAAIGALMLALAGGLGACSATPVPAPTATVPAPVPTTTGPFVARPTAGPRPPAQAPEAPVLERYGAEPAETTYPVLIPAREHWPAPNTDAPGERFLIDSARRHEDARFLVSTDEVAYVAMRDLVTWDATKNTPEALAERMSTWFVEEADPIVAEEITSRWAEWKKRGTRSQLQSVRDASEWGTPADTREVSYRALEVTMRLTDADGSQRVEQWIAFITLTTSGESPAPGTKMIMSYRLALA